VEFRKGPDCITQATEAYISNVPAPNKEERYRIMYSNINLPCKVEIDAVECKKGPDCITQVTEAFISNTLSS
jgi:hypothetical protein